MSFQAVQKKISKSEGIPMENAGAILAKSRDASAMAKKKNPSLPKKPMGKAPSGFAAILSKN